MATNNEQFQASVVAGIETPGSAQATQVFSNLLKLVEGLEGAAKDAGLKLVEAFQAQKKPEELAVQIRILQRELRFLATVSKGADLFKSDQVTKVNEIQRAITAAAKAYDAMRQSAALSRYELGLDSKTLREASDNMRVLEKNLKAVDLALQNNSGDKALLQKKQLLSDNKALLEVLIRDLKQQAEQEKLNEQIAQQNWSNAKSRFAEVQRLARQRKELEGSAREETRVSNAQFDYSQTGRDYASMQQRIRYAGVTSSLMPGQEDIALRRIRDTANRGYLEQAYRDAGMAPTVLSATLRDGPKVKAIMAEIKDIETRIVAERAKGNIDLQNEAKLLDNIRTRMLAVENLRFDANLNDPARRQARQDSQARNMLNRAGGEGGAALLAVQASLMANYSILSSTVGAMRSAVGTSVELEASFRNVQAVTGTTKTEMGALETKIKDVAAASKFSSLEVADAALILGQAGLSAKQVGEALQPVVMLASAAGTSIAQAVDLVTSVIGVFDKNTADIADIANKITQAANASKVSVEKLALGFQYAGNAAAQSGISFEEVTAAMAAMSNAGIKNGSTMGTGLRQFLTETEKPSKEFIASLQRIGLSITDIDFKSHGLVGVIQRLREAGFVASDAIKSFDVRGAAAFNALIANPDELERQYRLLLDTKAGVQANEIQMDSLKSQASRLTTSLGNLASTGFDPLSKLLASTLGGFATLTQAVSEHNVVVGVAGTAIAALLASGAASYISSMAAGALRLSAGAGAASAAVLALQSASKAGSMGMLVSSISSAVAGMAAWTPAAAGATAATWTLSGAVNGLKTAFLGLSITAGIGLAIAALTAGFWAYNTVVNSTTDAIDKLKATTNTSKGAFEEKDAAVSSLSKKIEELTYKENSLRSNSEALKTESMSLVSQFGAIGYQADANNVSFDTMISKLKSLKTEMSEIRKQSLETALSDSRALLQKQVDKAQDDMAGFSGRALMSRNYAADITKVLEMGVVKSLPAANQQKIRLAAEQLRGGNLDKMGDVPGATLILQKVLSDLRAKGVDDSRTERLDILVEKLVSVGKSITDANMTKSDIARQEAMLARDEAYRKYNESGRFGNRNGKPMTFEESLPAAGSLELIALKNQGKTGITNPLEIYDAMKAEQTARAQEFNTRLDQLKKDAKLGVVSPETFSTFKQLINARAEKDKNELLEMASATEDEYGLRYDRQKALLQARLNNQKTKKNKAESAEIERQLAALEIEKATRAEVSPVKALRTTEELNRIRDQKIQNIFDKTDRSGLRARNFNEGITERSLRLQAEAKEAEAEEIKNSTKTATSMEELSQLLDKAVAARIEAKAKRIEALAKKQENESKQPDFDKANGGFAHKLEMMALIGSENSKINSFATSFVGLLEAAMNRLDEVTKNINAQKRKISEDKWKGEDRVFEAQQELRELELQMALGKKTRAEMKSSVIYGKESSGLRQSYYIDSKGERHNRTTFESPFNFTKFSANGVTVDGRGTGSSKTTTNLTNEIAGVSGAIRETLTQRRNRLIVESTKIELEENEKLLKEYGDENNGLIGNMTKAYQAAKEKVKLLSERLAKETDEAKRSGLTAQLENATKQEADSFRDLRQAKGEQKQLRKDNFDIRKRQSENTEAIPQEVTLDNLLDKLDQVWDKYAQTVGQMDVIKTIGDGLGSVLGSLTGQLGNAFAAVATGTKSVKEAFKDMSASVIKAMLDILAQALAMQAINGVMSFFGPGVIGAGVATGGLIVPGGVQRVRGMAGGGRVTGGTPNRDSVPTMLMPGEFVLRKSAVEAVGTDYLHSLNAATNSVVSSSSPKMPQQQPKESGVVNVWVVSPDQKPSGLGPKDVVVVVADDINRGGTLKKLIKSVQTGQV